MSADGGGGALPAAAIGAILDVLGGFGAEAVLIGAVALAAHHYPRSTVDVDLAVGVDPRKLRGLPAVDRRLDAWLRSTIGDGSDT